MQKLIAGPVEGYKIFNEDLTCRGFQFELDKINELGNNDPLKLCKNGFHFCKYPSGVWAYYGKGRVFKIRAYDVLELPEEPGADLKLVCRKIELVKEITFIGDLNTGNFNTGNRNTGDYNTGDLNIGNRNTGNFNTGDLNIGNRNTGNFNTGNFNTGNFNTGDYNTGNFNTGDYNTGNFNTGNFNIGSGWSGSLNLGEAPFFLFNKIADRSKVNFSLVYELYELLLKPEPIDPTPFLSLPNATKTAIKKLHQFYINERKKG